MSLWKRVFIRICLGTIRFAFTKLYFFSQLDGIERKRMIEDKNVIYIMCMCVRATDKMFYSSRAIYHFCLFHIIWKMFRFAKKKQQQQKNKLKIRQLPQHFIETVDWSNDR